MKTISIIAIIWLGSIHVARTQNYTGKNILLLDTLELPFLEDWSFNSIDPFVWEGDAEWAFAANHGNPFPAVNFQGNQDLNNYTKYLASCFFDTQMLSFGPFYLSMDIRLESLENSGTESIRIEVFDGNEWQLIDQLFNSESFDWTTFFFDISDHISDRISRVRFVATGEQSNHIEEWTIDNIQLYRVCDAPKDLTAVYFWNPDMQVGEVQLNWSYTDHNDESAEFLEGFYVYRKKIEELEYNLYDFEAYVFNEDDYDLINEYSDLEWGEVFCYQVRSFWEDTQTGDECFSEPAGLLDDPAMDESCVLYTSAADLSAEKSIEVYPTPVDDYLYVNASAEITSFSLFDMLGNKLQSGSIQAHQGTINVLALPSGLYLLKLEMRHLTTTRKLVVHH